jgi:hypothetical protein
MSRTLYALTSLAIVSILFAQARAADPGLVNVDTLLLPQSSLLSSSTKPAFNPLTMPDLHLSTPAKAAPSTATTSISLPTFATGQVVLSSRPTSSRSTTPLGNDSLLGLNTRSDATPLLLTGIAGQSASPSTSTIVTPALLRDTGSTFASPALYAPPANLLENSHPLLTH